MINSTTAVCNCAQKGPPDELLSDDWAIWCSAENARNTNLKLLRKQKPEISPASVEYFIEKHR